eukprot:COSAG06_NODE_7647_length_2429_cov_46.675397_3_plen_124_part_00
MSAHRVRDAQVREQPQQVLDLLHLRHARLVHLLARVGAVNLTRDYVAVLLVRVLLRQRVRAPAAANAHLSQLFSYARPEPVLVNRSFFSIKKGWLKHNKQACCYLLSAPDGALRYAITRRART